MLVVKVIETSALPAVPDPGTPEKVPAWTGVGVGTEVMPDPEAVMLSVPEPGPLGVNWNLASASPVGETVGGVNVPG